MKKKGVRIILFIFVILLLFSLFLFRIWLSSEAVKLAYEVDSLIAEKESLEEENSRIMIEIAECKSPENIRQIATDDLKMVRSIETKVIIVER